MVELKNILRVGVDGELVAGPFIKPSESRSVQLRKRGKIVFPKDFPTQLIQLQQQGLTRTAIAQKLEIPYQTLCRRIRLLTASGEIPAFPGAPRRLMPESRLLDVKKLRSEGFSREEIGRQLLLTPAQVKQTMSKLLKYGEVVAFRRAGEESESYRNIIRDSGVGWQGYGLEGQELEKFIEKAGEKIDQSWEEVLGQEDREVETQIYEKIAEKVGYFAISVIEKSVELLNSKDEHLQEVAKKIIFHQLLSSVISSIKRIRRCYPGSVFRYEEFMGKGLEWITRALVQPGITVETISGLPSRLNTRLFSYAEDKGRNALFVGMDGVSEAERVEQQWIKAVLASVNGSLSAREQEVWAQRYEQGLTLEGIGNNLGLTKERVRQIESRVFKECKKYRLIQQILWEKL